MENTAPFTVTPPVEIDVRPGVREVDDDHERVATVVIFVATAEQAREIVDLLERELDEAFPDIKVAADVRPDWPRRWLSYHRADGKVVAVITRARVRDSVEVRVHPRSVDSLDDSGRLRAVTEAEQASLMRDAPTTIDGTPYVPVKRRGRVIAWAHPRTSKLEWRMM